MASDPSQQLTTLLSPALIRCRQEENAGNPKDCIRRDAPGSGVQYLPLADRPPLLLDVLELRPSDPEQRLLNRIQNFSHQNRHRGKVLVGW